MATVDKTDSDSFYFYEAVGGTRDIHASETIRFTEDAAVYTGSNPFARPYTANIINDRYYAILEEDLDG